jgi:hypothetical protein
MIVRITSPMDRLHKYSSTNPADYNVPLYSRSLIKTLLIRIQETNGEWRNSHDEELLNVCRLSSVIEILK